MQMLSGNALPQQCRTDGLLIPCVRRCRCADYVVLNKTDLLKEGELEQLQAIVASLNPFATARTALKLPWQQRVQHCLHIAHPLPIADYAHTIIFVQAGCAMPARHRAHRRHFWQGRALPRGWPQCGGAAPWRRRCCPRAGVRRCTGCCTALTASPYVHLSRQESQVHGQT